MPPRSVTVVRWALLWLAAALSVSAWPHPDPEDFGLPFVAHGAASSGAPGKPRPVQQSAQELPLRPTRRIAFDTDEGTWMSIDVAPDDRSLVFDLLGDLYSLPIDGGRARSLTQGMSFDSQPVFSPDGQWIAFVSDRSGADNLWLIRPDGSDLRQVSFGDDDTVLVSPAWAPDGRSIFISRYVAGLDSYELWRYGVDGTESLIVPIKDDAAPRSTSISSLGAVSADDGRALIFSRRSGEDDFDIGRWSVVRRELADGRERTLLPEPVGPGGRAPNMPHFRPVLSHDGHWLAYATRRDGQTGLRLRDLRSGADRWLLFPIESDQIQAYSWLDLLPRYAFTHDDSALILSRRGKFERVPLDGAAPQPIPFVAAVDLPLAPLLRVDVPEESGPVSARLIQTPEQSPDGRRLAFSALGRVYVQQLAGRSAPRLLTNGTRGEFHPSWSPDGRSIVYVTWTASEGGHVWVASASGHEAPRRISERAAFYTRPVFTPDGAHIVALRSEPRARLRTIMEFGPIRDAELVMWPAAGGAARVVHAGTLGGKPHFGPERDQALLLSPAGLVQIDLATGALQNRIAVLGPGWYFQDGAVPVDDMRLSPDGRWLLALVAQQLHLLEMPAKAGQTIDLSNPALRHRRITTIGADFFEWADDGRTIAWALGATHFRRPLADIRLNAPDHPDWTADEPARDRSTDAFEAIVRLPRDRPQGTLLLRGARVITMRGDEVIDDADLLIRDGRIAAVGPRGHLRPPPDVQILDVTGKTILPGFVDMHDHVADIRRDVLSTDSWGLRARLAYGITTAFDPSTLSIDMFAYQDLIDAGLMTGSRLRSTGTAMFSFNRLSSRADARHLLLRYRDAYRTRNVKQYLIGHRRARQWLAAEARELGMMPTTEGYLSLKLDLTMVMDGYAGVEHSFATPLYRDVTELLARSGTSNDTTLQIRNGSAPAQDFFIVRDRPMTDAKFRRTRPYAAVVATAQSRHWSDDTQSNYRRFAGDVARVQRAGGVVGMGAHGEVPGPGFHWELEAHVHGGMTPIEALHAGTIGSATAIGRARDLGSVEAGKLADLVILDSDPREDIRRSRDINRVMVNGRLYDASSLDELWPRQRPSTPAWFADESPSALDAH